MYLTNNDLCTRDTAAAKRIRRTKMSIIMLIYCERTLARTYKRRITKASTAIQHDITACTLCSTTEKSLKMNSRNYLTVFRRLYAYETIIFDYSDVRSNRFTRNSKDIYTFIEFLKHCFFFFYKLIDRIV